MKIKIRGGLIMAVRKIRKIGDPVLREKSKEVKKIDKGVLKLVEDMVDTISKGEEAGVGLAAPQIGVPKRVIVVNFGDKVQAFINPEIEILNSEQIEDEEGCLSVYSMRARLKRAKKIRLKAMDLKGNNISLEAEGVLARIFQHEIDHLNGVLFLDHLDKKSKRELLAKISEIDSNLMCK